MKTTAVELVFLASGNITDYSVGPSHESLQKLTGLKSLPGG